MKQILLSTIAIKSVTIDYCNKNFVAIEFCYNKIFLLLSMTLPGGPNNFALGGYALCQFHKIQLLYLQQHQELPEAQ